MFTQYSQIDFFPLCVLLYNFVKSTQKTRKKFYTLFPVFLMHFFTFQSINFLFLVILVFCPLLFTISSIFSIVFHFLFFWHFNIPKAGYHCSKRVSTTPLPKTKKQRGPSVATPKPRIDSFCFSNQRKKPFTISSSASFSVNPSVISFTSCSPAIFPIAAS